MNRLRQLGIDPDQLQVTETWYVPNQTLMLLWAPVMVDIRTSWVTVQSGAVAVEAYLAEPLEAGIFPGIIVIQEIFGVNSHIQAVTDRIAKAGYVAIAPAIFQRTAPGLNLGYTTEDTVIGRTHKDQTTASNLLADVQAAIAFLQGKSNVRPDQFGAIGFCFGGHVVYLAATLPQIQAAASFYGAGIATFTPGGGAPTITRTCEIKGTLYAFFGTQDPLIPNEQADQIEAELKKCAIPHQVFRYSAGHGFFCDQRGDYNSDAASHAWEQVKQLFQTALKG
jgi:carboxymethylenebutenolidase